MNFVPGKNKRRLYIILQHRMELPGFHWAIMLAPKNDSIDMQTKDCHVFHVTNTFQPGTSDHDGPPDWRYEEKPDHSMRSGTLVARILVAKLPADTPVETQVALISEIVRRVEIIQHDRNWTCRVWVESALAALRDTGGYFSTIPEIKVGSQAEDAIKAFGEQAKVTIREGNGLIKRASDLPQNDMRTPGR
jgi:hypothetical protein